MNNVKTFIFILLTYYTYTQGCSGKNIYGHTLRPGVQGAAQAPGGFRGSAPAAEALLMQIYAIQSHCEL